MQPEKNCLHIQQHRKKLFVLKKFSSPPPSKKIMVRPLNYYQVTSAIPVSLLSRSRNKYLQSFPKNIFLENHSTIEFNNSTKLNLEAAKVKDFYRLLNTNVHHCSHTGPTKQSKSWPINTEQWNRICRSVKQVSKENKLREFQFKILHQVVVTKRELCKFGIKDDSECLYCREQDSIEHTFSDCHFT